MDTLYERPFSLIELPHVILSIHPLILSLSKDE